MAAAGSVASEVSGAPTMHEYDPHLATIVSRVKSGENAAATALEIRNLFDGLPLDKRITCMFGLRMMLGAPFSSLPGKIAYALDIEFSVVTESILGKEGPALLVSQLRDSTDSQLQAATAFTLS